MIGDQLFGAVLKMHSRTYTASQARILAISMLCEIFSRAYSLNEMPHQKYLDTFYLVLREAFNNLDSLQSVLINGKDLLISDFPGIRSFIWDYTFSVQQIIPTISPALKVSISPDKIRFSSAHVISLLLVLSQTNPHVELVNSIIKDPYINDAVSSRAVHSMLIENSPDSDTQQTTDLNSTNNLSRISEISVTQSLEAQSVLTIPNTTVPNENIESLFNYSIQNLDTSSRNDSPTYRPMENGLIAAQPDTVSFDFSLRFFNDLNSNAESNAPKNLEEVYELLLPDLLLSISSETNMKNMGLLVNSIITLSMQDPQKSNELCIRCVELLLSEVSATFFSPNFF
ncbi:hypothetical protein AYI68_g4953 [Smittium mucronatum]|uniref:Uncharacterized protein n=1 Tax=Smittium mucronatum TaxID=133383 RepID=A0A1R0GVN3_9FUNG|nr:hypothetical protein AYI68_g4953 [Smittium mucronatum]